MKTLLERCTSMTRSCCRANLVGIAMVAVMVTAVASVAGVRSMNDTATPKTNPNADISAVETTVARSVSVNETTHINPNARGTERRGTHVSKGIQQLGGPCGDPDAGDCCEANGSPGCSDADCCNTICACDSFCCDTTWDSLCAGEGFGGTGCGAELLCEQCMPVPECGAPNTGNCCVANGSAYCDDATCCDAVCAQDAFCCDTDWDGTCADIANDICDTCQPFDCPDGSIPEPEACGEDVNGGCNMKGEPQFTPISCGDTYCGTAWFDGDTRDTDWYEINVPVGEAYNITFSGQADFDLLIGLIDNGGSGACAGTFAASATGFAGDEISFSAELTAGTWFFFAAPQFNDLVSCPAGYWVSLECDAIDPGCVGDINGDGIVDGADLQALDAAWGPCPFEGAPGTCEGACGGQSDDGCWCDESCCGFGDCCVDKFQLCGGCQPALGDCPADLNNDGVVDWLDVLILLDNWGCTEGPEEPIDCGCPKGASDSGEACGEDNIGGCGATPPTAEFYDAQDGESICGSSWAFDGSRDTDWYLVTVGASGTVSAELTAAAPQVVFIVDATDFESCAGIAVIGDTGHSVDCQPGTASASGLTPGSQVAVFVSVGNPDGSAIFDGYACGSNAGNDWEYSVAISAP